VRESSSDFRDSLLELLDASPEPVDHPTPDQWIAWHRGELSVDAEARLQEHLARCRGCFDLAEGAAAFAPPDEEPGADQTLETAALWRLLRPQLDPPADPPSQNVREISAGARRRPFGEGRLPLSLAASFFVALVGLTVWSLHQRSDLAALRAPKPDAPIYDFSSGERLPNSAERTLRASTGPWVLMFHPSEELPVYRLTLRDAAAGRELWSLELRPDEDLALTLQLPEGLRPGLYRLELADGSGGKAGRVLETHAVRVAGPRR